MYRYAQDVISQVRKLRSKGKTYSEIIRELQVAIPKSTLSDWCKGIDLPKAYNEKIKLFNIDNLKKGRMIALVSNQIKRETFLKHTSQANVPIAAKIKNRDVAKIALAMLCLGEASKSKGGASSFSLGNSDPRIVQLFIHLLQACFDSFSFDKMRCTVQCRADQNIEELESFWINITGVPRELFYPSRIDPRTIGKPTKKKEYKGVLRVDYFDSKVWIELETLADLVYNQVITHRGL